MNRMDRFSAFINRHPYPTALIIFAIFWSLFLVVSGSIFSGYHLADDHELLAMQNDFSAYKSIFEVMKKFILHDLNVMHRFKPFYYVHRVIEARLFGVNFTMWHSYTGLLAVLTSFLFFLYAKKTAFSTSESVLLPLMTLAGPHAVIWWSLGPNETIGMLMLSASLVCMAYGAYPGHRRAVYGPLFVLFAVLMSLSKESFILLIPAMIFWKVWSDKEGRATSWARAARRNIATALTLLVVMLAELLVIVLLVGTEGYNRTAGGLHEFNPLSYLVVAIKMTLSVSSVGLGLIILAGIVLLIFFRGDKGAGDDTGAWAGIRRFSKALICPAILFALITGPQFMLYARSGFYGRYLLPLVFGYSVLLVYLLRFLRTRSSLYFIRLREARGYGVLLPGVLVLIALVFIAAGIAALESPHVRALIYSAAGKAPPMYLVDILKPGVLMILAGFTSVSCAWVLLRKKERRLSAAGIILFLVVISVLYKTVFIASAYGFTLVGRQTASLLNSVKTGTEPNDQILIVSEALILPEAGVTILPEAAQSIRVYLRYFSGRKRLYSRIISPADDSVIKDTMPVAETPDYIVIFSGLEGRFFTASGGRLDASDFTREDLGLYVVYRRKTATANRADNAQG